MAGTSTIAWDYDGRFEIIRLLGGGGMGIVYEATDLHRQGRVALKTLVDSNVLSIVQLKSEFRALADLSHPNLVSLYELLEDHGRWYITMEYVPGVHFLEYIRQAESRQVTSREKTLPYRGMVGDEIDIEGDDESEDVRDEPIGERLRRPLNQITNGLMALHAAGKLHCDIKPSNVLVTPTGQVKLLDFGLVRSVSQERYRNWEPWIAGTLAYMSPEQAMGKSSRKRAIGTHWV